ncbi:MAG: hypothetical protein JWN38_1143 [Candidatus Saccharibacteria bacterium]|nr:hypothetical protein [Candidatus Saccharibacteria bacterium]
MSAEITTSSPVTTPAEALFGEFDRLGVAFDELRADQRAESDRASQAQAALDGRRQAITSEQGGAIEQFWASVSQLGALSRSAYELSIGDSGANRRSVEQASRVAAALTDFSDYLETGEPKPVLLARSFWVREVQSDLPNARNTRSQAAHSLALGTAPLMPLHLGRPAVLNKDNTVAPGAVHEISLVLPTATTISTQIERRDGKSYLAEPLVTDESYYHIPLVPYDRQYSNSEAYRLAVTRRVYSAQYSDETITFGRELQHAFEEFRLYIGEQAVAHGLELLARQQLRSPDRLLGRDAPTVDLALETARTKWGIEAPTA